MAAKGAVNMKNGNHAVKVVTFAEVPKGALFKVLHDEHHSLKVRVKGQKASTLVKNHGIYYKTEALASINVATREDCIFSPKQKCRVVNSKNYFDTSVLTKKE